LEIGTYYYHKGDGPMSTDILRRISADKALGPDGIPDKWIRKKRNGDELMEFINEWMNGTRPSPQD
jgi:hypothetical protein